MIPAVLLCAAVLCAGQPQSDEDLIGVWLIVRDQGIGGEGQLTGTECIVIAGDDFRVRFGDDEVGVYKFKLDPKHNPKHLDLTSEKPDKLKAPRLVEGH